MSFTAPEDTFLDVKDANLRVYGNVHADGLKLGQLEVVTTTSTGSTIQFLHQHTAFTTTSNIEVGTANHDLFVDTSTSRVGILTNTPTATLDVNGAIKGSFLDVVGDINFTGNLTQGGSSYVLPVGGTGSLTVPSGDTGQRPVPAVNGMLRYNSTIGFMEAYTVAGWGSIAQPPTVTGISPLTTLTSGGSTTGWSQEEKIQASPPLFYEKFGKSDVAISGDGTKVVVGTFPGTGNPIGSAYIFTYSSGSWGTGTKLVAPNPSVNDYFSMSLAMNHDGTKVIIGAPSEDSTADQSSSTGAGDSGAAYIFTYSNGSWDTGTMIKAEDAQGSDDFGQGVSMNSDGTKVLVGAQREDTGASDSGAAYIFTFSDGSWSQQAKIFPDVAVANGNFGGKGLQLSPDGTKAIVGAHMSPGAGGSTGVGAAYVFTYDGSSWSQQGKIMASDGKGDDMFGDTASISSDGTRVIVGAFSSDHLGGNSTGKAYIYTYSGGSWGSEVILQSNDLYNGDAFGISVSMSSDGTKVLVGAKYEDPDNVSNAGSAYIFALSGGSWSQEDKLQASDKQAQDYFGETAAMSSDGSKVIVGAWAEDAGDTEAGAAYIFNLTSVTDSSFVFDSLTQVFTATGTGIIPGSTVQLEGADGTLYSVFDTTTPNATGTQVTFKMGALGATGGYAVAQQPYKIRVNSKSGLSGVSTAVIGFAVGWTTAAGVDLTFTTEGTTTNTLVGTDGAGGTNRKFEVAPSSTALPAGLTLTGSTGAITGTITESAASGTTSVTFRLTDIGSDVFTDRAINIVWNGDAYTFSPNPFTFTNAGLYGKDGPDLTATKTAYGASGWWQTSTNFNQVSGKQGFQLWTVPSTGTYTIEAKGAQGGYRNTGTTYNANNTAVAPGNGATVKATFALTKGATVVLIVGQSAPREPHWPSGIGGGGASWVLKPGAFTSNNDVYLVAGGGGGSGSANYVTSTPQGGHANGSSQGTLGVGGNRGDPGVRNAGGGAGWTSDGQGYYQTTYYYGLKPSNGALGGNPYHVSHYINYQNPGGFGGGGSNGGECSGGGAGASGGRAASTYLSGDTIGGTSYIMPNGTGGVTVTARTFSGNHTDIHGSIIITQN